MTRMSVPGLDRDTVSWVNIQVSKLLDLRGHTSMKMATERQFGVVFSAVFALIAVAPLLNGGGVGWWALALAGGFAGITLLAPGMLRPLNLIWFRLGLRLGKIISPIALAIVFFTTITPIGLMIRLRNRDLLNQRADPDAVSYWIDVTRDEGAKTSMRNQF